MKVAIIAGVVLGVIYTLSPLTVLSVGALVALLYVITRELTPRERVWFSGLVTVAVTVRLAAIAALFLLADRSRPYANFFGDEELFKSRTLWLRNIGLGVPVSPADMIYAFDEVGRSSYLYMLAYIQALVGDAPYGNNILNVALYVSAVMLSYWLIRRIFGGITALAGAAFLLFVPSLFSWSIAVLKEPPYFLVASIELASAFLMVRAPRVWQRIAAAVSLVLTAMALGSLRVGGTEVAMAGTLVGWTAGLLVTRPRLSWAALAVAAIVAVAAFPYIEDRGMAAIKKAAFQHWGHVGTPGYSYKLLDPRFYVDESRVSVYTMTEPEAARYTVRAYWNFLTVPRASQIESRSALAYVPEQALWYSIVFLVPLGVVAGLRRDPVLTCLLLAHGLAASSIVALTGGNIGTLIRHRGLTFPYFTWLAALGACQLVVWLAARSRPAPFSAPPSGEPV